MKKHNQIQDMVQRLEKSIERQDDAAKIIDGKAQNILGATSLLLSIVGTLQFQYASLNVLLLAAIALYIVMFFISIRVLYPRQFEYPVKPEWDNIQGYLDMDEPPYWDQLIADYTRCIQINSAIVRRKANLVRISFWMLFGIVLLLLLSAGLGW